MISKGDAAIAVTIIIMAKSLGLRVLAEAVENEEQLSFLRARLSVSAERGRTLATLPGEVPDPADPPPGCPFEPRCALAVSACLTSPPDLVVVDEGHLSACIR